MQSAQIRRNGPNNLAQLQGDRPYDIVVLGGTGLYNYPLLGEISGV